VSGMWPDGAGEFMFSLFGDPAAVADGPPWTHTFRPPEPEYDEEGNEIWREPDPTHTLTEGGTAGAD
jgi:hypothetical protein